MRVNDISQKWEKWFRTCVTLITYILRNDQWILLIFGTQVEKTTTFCSRNGYCQILVTFWAIWRQNFDNFFLGHTVEISNGTFWLSEPQNDRQQMEPHSSFWWRTSNLLRFLLLDVSVKRNSEEKHVTFNLLITFIRLVNCQTETSIYVE